MKSLIVIAVGLGLAASATLTRAQDAPKGEAAAAAPAGPALKDLKAKVSYAIGLSFGRNLKKQAVDIDTTVFARGLAAALSGAKPELTDQQAQEAMTAFQEELRTKQMELAKTASSRNLKEGDAFLAANKSKEGVKVLPSGLQYKVIKNGTGPTPKASDTVKTHYKGTLIDGTPFDSSYDRGEPATFPVNGVIKGWTEALQLMKVGSKWQLIIPANLAYGERPQPGSPIGPNSVLLFDIELLGIE